MNKLHYLLLFGALFALGLNSCSFMTGNGTDSYNKADLTSGSGLWQDDQVPTHFMQFTTLVSDTIEAGYCYGYEWDEAEQLQTDLVEHGNGWFEWRLSGKNLSLYLLSDLYASNVSKIKTPKDYTVSVLSATKFSYTNGNKTYTFSKK